MQNQPLNDGQMGDQPSVDGQDDQPQMTVECNPYNEDIVDYSENDDFMPQVEITIDSNIMIKSGKITIPVTENNPKAYTYAGAVLIRTLANGKQLFFAIHKRKVKATKKAFDYIFDRLGGDDDDDE